MPKNIKTVPTKDYEDVVVTVSKYVEGLRVGSVTTVSQAFHNDSVMYGFTNGELLNGSIKNLYNFVEKNGTAPNIKDTNRRTLYYTNNCGCVCRHSEGCNRSQLHGFPYVHQAQWDVANPRQGLSHVRRMDNQKQRLLIILSFLYIQKFV